MKILPVGRLIEKGWRRYDHARAEDPSLPELAEDQDEACVQTSGGPCVILPLRDGRSCVIPIQVGYARRPRLEARLRSRHVTILPIPAVAD